jgi:hypothetical protein
MQTDIRKKMGAVGEKSWWMKLDYDLLNPEGILKSPRETQIYLRNPGEISISHGRRR